MVKRRFVLAGVVGGLVFLAQPVRRPRPRAHARRIPRRRCCRRRSASRHSDRISGARILRRLVDRRQLVACRPADLGLLAQAPAERASARTTPRPGARSRWASFWKRALSGLRVRFSFSSAWSSSSVLQQAVRRDAKFRFDFQVAPSLSGRCQCPLISTEGETPTIRRGGRRDVRRPSDGRLAPVLLPASSAAPRAAVWALLTALALLLVVARACRSPARAQVASARIGSSDVFTWDPALQGDAGTASVLAQVYEGLTTFDAQSNVQPALARPGRSPTAASRSPSSCGPASPTATAHRLPPRTLSTAGSA